MPFMAAQARRKGYLYAIYGGSSPKKGIPLCHLWRLKPDEGNILIAALTKKIEYFI